MNKKLSNFLSFALGIFLFVFLIWRVGVKEIIATFQSFSFINLFLLIALGFIIIVPSALVWNRVLKLNGIYAKLNDVLNVSFAGDAISYLTPSAYFGGEPVRAWIMKRLYGTDTTLSLSTIMIEKFLKLSAYFFCSMTGILFIFTIYYLPAGIEFMLAITVSISVLLYLFFFVTIFTGKGTLGLIINKFHLYKIRFIRNKQAKIMHFDHLFVDFFVRNWKEAIKQFLFMLSVVAITLLRYYVIIRAFGYSPTFFEVLIIYAIASFAFLVPVVPGALGVYEIIMVFIATLFYGDASLGIGIAFMTRFSDLARVLYGLFSFLRFRLKLSSRTMPEFSV